MGQYSSNLDEGRIIFDSKRRESNLASTKAKDLVCGDLVDPRDALIVRYSGHSYYFCSPECQVRFEADPTKFGNS